MIELNGRWFNWMEDDRIETKNIVSVLHSITALLLISAPSFYYLPFNSLIFQSILLSSMPFYYLPFHSIIFQSVMFLSIKFNCLPFNSLMELNENKAGYTATSCGQVGWGRNAQFPAFWLDHYGPTDGPTDGQTDGWTDGRTDGQSLL